MRHAQVPIIGFAAYSGTGKTTLLTQLIPQLKQQGLRVGLIKHSHHSFDIDHPGKDSFRLREAGAATVMLVSSRRRAIMTEFAQATDPDLDEQLSALNQSQLDIILVEGFKQAAFPKIELYRPVLNHPLLYPTDANIIAIATDTPLLTPAHLPVLDINQPLEITRFILNLVCTADAYLTSTPD
ncbi:MAG: molybdopterin-guanine dinucleotide biosynthesis protein B [Methylococcaceae bacterium]